MQKKIGNELLTVQIDMYPEGNFMTYGRVDLPAKKSDYTETVLQMLNEGHKQKDIAFNLGISQALVSKIKNNSK